MTEFLEMAQAMADQSKTMAERCAAMAVVARLRGAKTTEEAAAIIESAMATKSRLRGLARK